MIIYFVNIYYVIDGFDMGAMIFLLSDKYCVKGSMSSICIDSGSL